ncbi:hypothetical protein ColTof4_01127 [Colletotrichum tofieldiae]|nr:hypothetical protein ColTof3_08352 [Colletotrichum tofieldiae]GKT68704.1 hypothetical protein ColTof4_01127 [Colletotrichum tofieldiae]GKT96720.1 hypothetical protein Ct61P_14570 [Colletotrichum tofieldiae]
MAFDHPGPLFQSYYLVAHNGYHAARVTPTPLYRTSNNRRRPANGHSPFPSRLRTPDRANVCLGIIGNAPTSEAAGKIAEELLDDEALHDIKRQARGRRLKQISNPDSKWHQTQVDYLDGQ